ncbi:unnamed protein product [Boreogadus saida]
MYDLKVIESLGIMVYNALDYGLKETEERELSAPLEQLINHMINMAEAEKDACYDEGYEATEEDEEAEDEPGCAPGTRCYRDLLKICTSHLPGQSDAPIHYQAVCRALYSETKELRTFLEKIRSAKEHVVAGWVCGVGISPDDRRECCVGAGYDSLMIKALFYILPSPKYNSPRICPLHKTTAFVLDSRGSQL